MRLVSRVRGIGERNRAEHFVEAPGFGVNLIELPVLLCSQFRDRARQIEIAIALVSLSG